MVKGKKMELEEAKTLSPGDKVKIIENIAGKGLLLCKGNVTEVASVQQDCYDDEPDEYCVFVKCLAGKGQTYWPYEGLEKEEENGE
jgi:hypothetical protein